MRYFYHPLTEARTKTRRHADIFLRWGWLEYFPVADNG